MQLSAELLEKCSVVTTELLDPTYISLPSFHPEKHTDLSSVAIAIRTAFQHLFYFSQDNNYFKGFTFKNKDYTVSRILLETLLDIAKCFIYFCPGIWPLGFPCHKLLSFSMYFLITGLPRSQDCKC